MGDRRVMYQLEAGKADQREPVSVPQKTVGLDFVTGSA